MVPLEDVLYRLGKPLISPKEAFETHLLEKYGSSLPIAVYLIMCYSYAALTINSISAFLNTLLPGSIVALVTALAGIIGALSGLLTIVTIAAVIHFTARILGYEEGEWESMLGLLAYSTMPMIFPLFATALSYLSGQLLALLIPLFLTLIFGLWTIYLGYVATKVNYGMTTEHALLASIVAPLVFSIITFTLLAALGPAGIIVVLVLMLAIYLLRR